VPKSDRLLARHIRLSFILFGLPSVAREANGWAETKSHLAQLLIEKGVFTEQEFYAKLKEVDRQYQAGKRNGS